MGLFRRCKEQWALVKEMRTMFKAEWERARDLPKNRRNCSPISYRCVE